MPVRIETFRCMMCGHEYREKVEEDEDKERACPKCRSNSIRRLEARGSSATDLPPSTGDPR
jgi:DNA-directed RNA polymerase subunit RPC12/RpoP